MPFANEHAGRVKSPDAFIEGSFRRKPITEGIDLIVGRLKDGDGSAVAQSYRFDREAFTAREARDWLKEHDVTVQLFEEAIGEEKTVGLKANMEGAMVALFLPAGVPPVPIGLPRGSKPEPADHRHITLAYLGSDASQLPVSKEQVVEMLSRLAADQAPIEGEVSGMGRFLPEEGDECPFYASFDSPDLPAFRQRVVDMLEAAGVPVVKEHGFTPHVTLAYLPKDVPTPDYQPDPVSVVFKDVVLTWGDERHSIAFAGEPIETKQDDKPFKDDVQEKSTLEGEISREQQEIGVRRAFEAALEPMQQPAVAVGYTSRPWIVDTYSSSVICEWAGKYYEVPFMRIGDEIAFAAQEDWVEVEKREEWLRKVKEMRAEAKAGRRVRSDKISILRELKTKLDDLFKGLGEILGWAEYEDRKPQKLSKGFKVIRTKDGEDWLLTWTTNAFEDRDGEIFQTKAIEEYVGRHEDQKDKGAFEFWHIPGSKFGTIRWQGVSGRFLAEAGPFDDTVVGQTFKAFLMEFPDGHPVIAPEGWGTSHGFRYRADDRKGGVYRWFEKEETSVLPGSVAANPYNPELEVIQMLSKKQIEALREIGGDKIVDLVTETGEKRTEELERAGVAYKAKKAGDLPSQLEAIAAEMEDEDMAKELRKLAGKIAKAVSKGKKEEPAEETEPTAADIPSGLGEFVAPLQAIASKTEGEVKTGLEGVLAAMQPAAEPAATKAADEPITRAEMEGVVQVLGAGIANLAAEVKALSQSMGQEVRREVKEKLEETPRISLIELAAKSVIGKEETRVDGRKELAKDGPKETDPSQLPEGRMFGIPLLDALKAAGQRQPQ